MLPDMMHLYIPLNLHTEPKSKRHKNISQFPSIYGLLNCSFLKNAANPIQTTIWKIKPNQNAAVPKPLRPMAKLGNTFPGPVLSGAVSRARIVATEPSTWAAMRVNVI